MHQAGFKKDSPVKRIVMRGMRARGGYHEEQYFDQSIGDILRHDVCKINCRVTSPELERDLKAYLAERSDRVVNAPFDPVMFEITDVACNKGESVAWLAGYYALPRMSRGLRRRRQRHRHAQTLPPQLRDQKRKRCCQGRRERDYRQLHGPRRPQTHARHHAQAEFLHRNRIM